MTDLGLKLQGSVLVIGHGRSRPKIHNIDYDNTIFVDKEEDQGPDYLGYFGTVELPNNKFDHIICFYCEADLFPPYSLDLNENRLNDLMDINVVQKLHSFLNPEGYIYFPNFMHPYYPSTRHFDFHHRFLCKFTFLINIQKHFKLHLESKLISWDHNNPDDFIILSKQNLNELKPTQADIIRKACKVLISTKFSEEWFNSEIKKIAYQEIKEYYPTSFNE